VFTASAPLLWVSGVGAIVLLVVAVLAAAPVPVILGPLASEQARPCGPWSRPAGDEMDR
jgi:hypothetical protein